MDIAAMRQAGIVLPMVRERATTLDAVRRSPLGLTEGQWTITTLSTAVAGAERAASLLGSIGIPHDAVRALEDAARLLHQAAPSDPGLEPALDMLKAASLTAGDALTARITALAPDDARALMRSILETPTESLTSGDWALIETLLAADSTALVQRGPRELIPYLSFARVAASNAARPATDHADRVATHRYLDAWRAAEFGPAIPADQHARVVRDIIAKDPAAVSLDEWRSLGRILDAPAEASPLHGPRTIAGTPFAQAAWTQAIERTEGTHVLSMAELERYFAAWRMADLSHAQRADIVGDIMRTEPASLTREQWNRLRAAFDAGIDPALLRGPVAFDDGPTLATLSAYSVNDATRPGVRPGNGLARFTARYHAAWTGTDIPLEQREGALRAIIAKEPAQITATEWRTLGTLLDLPAGSGVPDGPRMLPGDDSFAAAAHTKALDPTKYEPSMARYFAAWRGIDIAPDQRAATARAIVAKEREQITPDEWRTLGTLIDLDAGGAIVPGPRTLPSRPAFAQVAWTFATKSRPTATDVLRADEYLTASRLAALPADERQRLVRELVVREPATLGNEQWRRLWMLIELDPTLMPSQDAAREATKLMRYRASEGLLPPDDPTIATKLEGHFVELRLRSDPGFAALLERAYADAASGTASPQSRQLLLMDRASLNRRAAGLPDVARVRLAMLVADSEHAGTLDGTRALLQLLHPAMDRYAGLGDGLEPIRQQTITLIDQNLQRIAGATPDGAVTGFGNHPEYADIGRIRSNIALLESGLAARSTGTVDSLAW